MKVESRSFLNLNFEILLNKIAYRKVTSVDKNYLKQINNLK